MEQGFDIRGVLQKLLALPVRDEAQLQRAAALGWEGPPLDYGTLLLIALLEAAVGGNLSAIKTAHTEDGILFTVTFEKYSDGTVYLSGAEVLPTRPPAIPNIPNQRGRLYCRPQTVYSQYMTP